MAIELATKYQPYTDDQFSTESKKALVTNTDFDWTGAHTIKIYSVSTSAMNDYDREGDGPNISRYGPIERLGATTQEMTLKKDRSFTFAIDHLDEDETLKQVQSASALARQNRIVSIPEIEAYVYGVMCEEAGHKPEAKALTSENIYDEIATATEALDDAEVSESDRVLIVPPSTYRLLKQSPDVAMETDVGNELRLKGVIARLDGMSVQKVPANRLPGGFGFMVCHPVATVAPTKLESYQIHENPPFINGDLVEGRICYDAFVLDNKTKAIYYQATTTDEEALD